VRILYVASGIPVPGSLGGSTHVDAVADGLARRGHRVDVVAASREGWGGLAPFARPVTIPNGAYRLHHQDVPKSLALLGAWPIMRLARALRPDAIIERYYNFAGAGVLAARRLGIPCLLEVNALIVDPPAVLKRRLDDALGGPMRRWALAQCRWATRIVTPLHTTVPPEIPREKIVELPWGADVERFTSDELRVASDEPEGTSSGGRSLGTRHSSLETIPTVVFLGSFRAWHGAADFVRAGVRLLEAGRRYRFLLIGDGPQRAEVEALARAWPEHFVFTGAVPHERVPALLRGAQVGVAPFSTAAHPALRAAGFFWSPLKVYEYMAAGLPVVTIDIPPLNEAVRHGREGLLFREGDVGGLAAAIGRLLDDAPLAAALGAAGRARVMERYSWQRHCAELEQILLTAINR
jgi:starch synthase